LAVSKTENPLLRGFRGFFPSSDHDAKQVRWEAGFFDGLWLFFVGLLEKEDKYLDHEPDETDEDSDDENGNRGGNLDHEEENAKIDHKGIKRTKNKRCPQKKVALFLMRKINHVVDGADGQLEHVVRAVFEEVDGPQDRQEQFVDSFQNRGVFSGFLRLVVGSKGEREKTKKERKHDDKNERKHSSDRRDEQIKHDIDEGKDHKENDPEKAEHKHEQKGKHDVFLIMLHEIHRYLGGRKNSFAEFLEIENKGEAQEPIKDVIQLRKLDVFDSQGFR
jgi:hypothetical protein